MKTFAVIAIAGFAIFLMTAVYLLRGGEKPRLAQSQRQATPATTAVESRPRGKVVTLVNVPSAEQPDPVGSIEETMRKEPPREPAEGTRK